MFLNYMAGAVSLVLAVSAFLPWVTVWFYSLKGNESAYGIGILVMGLLGMAIAIFQHLSGKIRGRTYILLSVLALGCEGLYFRKMAKLGETLNEVVGYLTDIFGNRVMEKVQQILGDEWTRILAKTAQRMGLEPSVNGFDFIGNGLILAGISALGLLVLGVLLEYNKSLPD